MRSSSSASAATSSVSSRAKLASARMRCSVISRRRACIAAISRPVAPATDAGGGLDTPAHVRIRYADVVSGAAVDDVTAPAASNACCGGGGGLIDGEGCTGVGSVAAVCCSTTGVGCGSAAWVCVSADAVVALGSTDMSEGGDGGSDGGPTGLSSMPSAVVEGTFAVESVCVVASDCSVGSKAGGSGDVDTATDCLATVAGASGMVGGGSAGAGVDGVLSSLASV